MTCAANVLCSFDCSAGHFPITCEDNASCGWLTNFDDCGGGYCSFSCLGNDTFPFPSSNAAALGEKQIEPYIPIPSHRWPWYNGEAKAPCNSVTHELTSRLNIHVLTRHGIFSRRFEQRQRNL